jgi:hypothetical protein
VPDTPIARASLPADIVAAIEPIDWSGFARRVAD